MAIQCSHKIERVSSYAVVLGRLLTRYRVFGSSVRRLYITKLWAELHVIIFRSVQYVVSDIDMQITVMLAIRRECV
jgi:hypothetical protein